MRSEPIDEKAVYNIARRIASLEARCDYLEQVCGDNPEVMQRVVELLRVHDEEQSFLEAPPLAVDVYLTLDQPLAEKPGADRSLQATGTDWRRRHWASSSWPNRQSRFAGRWP